MPDRWTFRRCLRARGRRRLAAAAGHTCSGAGQGGRLPRCGCRACRSPSTRRCGRKTGCHRPNRVDRARARPARGGAVFRSGHPGLSCEPTAAEASAVPTAGMSVPAGVSPAADAAGVGSDGICRCVNAGDGRPTSPSRHAVRHRAGTMPEIPYRRAAAARPGGGRGSARHRCRSSSRRTDPDAGRSRPQRDPRHPK